jgi:putative RNA 2'-phosphotransferase
LGLQQPNTMTDPKIVKRASRKLSLVLRHAPEAIGLTLDKQGWAKIPELLKCLKQHKLPIKREDLDHIVAENNKQRFGFSENGLKIRAKQGHSIPVDLGLKPVTPPDQLYHGTAGRFLSSIFKTGLEAQSRQHVHLSADGDTAINVGGRHGNPVILLVHQDQSSVQL